MTILRETKIWSFVLQDMKEPLGYLPQAVLFGLLAITVGFFLLRKQDNRNGLRLFIVFLFTVYLSVLLREAFFSRAPGSRAAVDMVFLGTWGRSPQGNAYVIENIIMFIPWGFLLPFLLKTLQRHGWLCVLFGFLASCSLEFAQFLTKRGYCQLDDVVMNTLGTLVGWCIFRLSKAIYIRLK